MEKSKKTSNPVNEKWDSYPSFFTNVEFMPLKAKSIYQQIIFPNNLTFEGCSHQPISINITFAPNGLAYQCLVRFSAGALAILNMGFHGFTHSLQTNSRIIS
jgi:hypothetical protein